MPFLQECILREDTSLKTRAASLGYTAFRSSLNPTRPLRQLVMLVKAELKGTTVDLVPGNLKDVTMGKQSFLFMYLLISTQDRTTTSRIFREAVPLFMADSCNLPAVDEDFNCIQQNLDITAKQRSKVHRGLSPFLSAFPLAALVSATLGLSSSSLGQVWLLQVWKGLTSGVS